MILNKCTLLNYQIANLLDIPRTSVRRLVNLHQEIDSVALRPVTGQPRVAFANFTQKNRTLMVSKREMFSTSTLVRRLHFPNLKHEYFQKCQNFYLNIEMHVFSELKNTGIRIFNKWLIVFFWDESRFNLQRNRRLEKFRGSPGRQERFSIVREVDSYQRNSVIFFKCFGGCNPLIFIECIVTDTPITIQYLAAIV